MPAQLEEVVANAHLLDLQYLGPNVCQGLLQLIARRLVILALQLPDLQRRQGLAVQFAVGVERQLVQPQPVQRHHVFRQFGTQALLDALQAFSRIEH
ncbi:hypothetical protein D3C84_640540 [compost metagenome]